MIPRFVEHRGVRPVDILARQVDVPTGSPHVFDSWQYDVLTGALPSEYDEERRLLYVAMSRAERHLLFTAGKDPSNFFTQLPIAATESEPEPSHVERPVKVSEPFEVSEPERRIPIRAGVHDIMDETVYEGVSEGRGKEFGQALHDFAEAYALSQDVTPDGEEQTYVANLIDSFDGALHPEQTLLCPLAGDPQITLTGILDLLHVADDHVDIIDYKTDMSRVAHEEYRLQLSIYWHVLQHEYPDRGIRAAIYYTHEDALVDIEPLALDDLRAKAEAELL